MSKKAARLGDGSEMIRRRTPHAPMRLEAARVLKGARKRPPLLPLVAEATESQNKAVNLKSEITKRIKKVTEVTKVTL